MTTHLACFRCCSRPIGGLLHATRRIHVVQHRLHSSWLHVCHSSMSSSESTDGALQLSNTSIADLQIQLDNAIANEDYTTAAQLRDVLTERRSNARYAVEEVNTAFYKAFEQGDIEAMERVWGQGDYVQCIHPRLECIAGRAQVMESWRLILGAAKMTITLEDVRVHAGEDVAFVTCIEVVDAGDSRGRVAATNVFEKQDGEWKLVHHQGGPA